MKKCAKWLAVFIAVVCLGAAMAACGDEKGEAYKFKATTIETTEGNESTMTDALSATMTQMFQDSAIKVTDKKIKWDIKDVGSQTLNCTKEGDKYILSGDYCKQVEDLLTSSYKAMGVEVSAHAEWSGVKTEEGYEILFVMTVDGFSVSGIQVPGFTTIAKYVFTKA